MNYYRRHIGDYLRDTAHLSLLEHGIYTRLLDIYYTREAPIPADQAARLIGARTKEERAALESVLHEFFTETDGRWEHSRCDREIAIAKELGEDAADRKANETERQRRHRERRKEMFEALRTHGIVPAWDVTTAELKRLIDAHVTSPVTRPVTQPVTQPVTACNAPETAIANSHKPIANNQESESRATRTRAPARTPGPEPGEERIRESDDAPTLAGKACRLMREAGVQRVNPSDPRLSALLAQGVTPRQLGDLAIELREAKGDVVGQAYLIAAMAGRLRDAASQPETPPGVAARGSPAGRSRADRISETVAEMTGRSRTREVIDVEAIDPAARCLG